MNKEILNYDEQELKLKLNGDIIGTSKTRYAAINTYQPSELQLGGIQKEYKNGKKYFKRTNICWKDVKDTDVVDVKGFILHHSELEKTEINYHTYNFNFKGLICYCNSISKKKIELNKSDIKELMNICFELNEKYKELNAFSLFYNYKGLEFEIGTYGVLIDKIVNIQQRACAKLNNKI